MLRRSYGTDTADRASVQPTRMKFHYLNVDELAPIPLERFGGGKRSRIWFLRHNFITYKGIQNRDSN